MKVEQNTLLKVNHSRKGEFTGIAMKDFDTEDTEFYPIAVAQISSVKGAKLEWEQGYMIPCKGSLCKIEIIDDTED